jgi:putative membrane protein
MASFGASVLGLVITAALGCSREPARSADDGEAPGPGMQPASGVVLPADNPSARAAPALETLDDPQILGLSRDIDSAELEQAKLAIGRARNEDVKSFASLLIAEHGRAEKARAELETRLSLTAADSETATKFRVERTAELNELGEKSGKQFDKLFLKTQVAAHERMLKLYDEVLIPRARHPELKRLVESARPRLATHGERARTLLEKLD